MKPPREPASAARRRAVRGLGAAAVGMTLGSLHTAASAASARASNTDAARKSGPVPDSDIQCASAARLFVDRFCQTGAALDNDNGNIWHTESLGVSMLAATAVKDERLFALLDGQARSVRRPDGLHSWKVQGGKVADSNNATDGDLFIAWAYLQAARAFPGARVMHLHAADELLAAIQKHCVRSTAHGQVLLPGIEGFIDGEGAVRTINLSYWVYPALQAFAQHDRKGPWSALIESGRKITTFAYFGDHALPPDWLELSKPVKPDSRLSNRFSYDAMRIPLYLHLAGMGSHPAVARCLKFFTRTGKTWADLLSGELSPYGIDPSAEVIVRQLRATRTQPATLRTFPTKYYPASLAVLAEMPVCG